MNNFNLRFAFIGTVLSFVLFFCNYTNPVSAQTADSVKTWNFQTDIYLIFPYMKGDIGMGKISAPLDANPGDIFSKLKFGGMLYLEAHNSKWAITSDLIYMNLNLDIPVGEVWNSGSVGAKQMVWEPAGFYRLMPFLEMGVGGRLNNIQSGIDGNRNIFLPAGTEEVNKSMSKTWFDPIIITRLTTDRKNKLNFQFRGDLGGFGVGSDFTWQLQAYAGYRFTKLFQLTAGYRYMSMDYDKGTDADRFIYNVATSGPELSFDFHF